MAVHDWTRVDAGIFHALHHDWITEIARVLNHGLLPDEYYALPEQQAAGFGPDVLTLQTRPANPNAEPGPSSPGTAAAVQTRPQTRFTAETRAEFYRRKKDSIAIRHVSGDRITAMVEVVSPENKSSQYALQALVEKACQLLEYRIHLLIVDLFPPSPRDPNGVHAAIWQQLHDEPFVLPKAQPLTLAAYECGLTTRAYIEAIGIGDSMPDMPLFLEPNSHVLVPLNATYEAAFAALPRRWRTVLESPAPHG
jgi:hypothetical protein